MDLFPSTILTHVYLYGVPRHAEVKKLALNLYLVPIRRKRDERESESEIGIVGGKEEEE